MTMSYRKIRVYGVVQGVGYRPFVSRLADEDHLTGNVCNKGPYVEIYAAGEGAVLDRFTEDLSSRAPERAVVLRVTAEEIEKEAFKAAMQENNTSDAIRPGDSRFVIRTSAKEKGEMYVSPDIAICETCKKELLDPTNRRYLHPFINCTACGPRVTIMQSMPYDRERTSMKMFPMCKTCREEYTNPESRRYDAQPVCCNDCGPRVKLLLTGEMDNAAITAARRLIAAGKIVAVKGIGGFHLCCDATNEEAVQRLRQRKRRPAKPLAVMMQDEKVAKAECEISPEEMQVLTGHQKPILLLKRKKDSSIAPSVAPGNPDIGVMLPYAPVQVLLFQNPDDVLMPKILVMTSGNISGAPICKDEETALKELSGIADAFLTNDRKILLRADDSVMEFYDHAPYMIRRSRGYAPLPFLIEQKGEGAALGIGGELKNTFCIAKGDLYYPSPYVGDLTDLRSCEALTASVARMEDLLEVKPKVICCDLHPMYHSREIAEKMGEELDVPVLHIQHHYAHILSCMAENALQEPVIGVSFDGTGYGTDESIWGGEILTCDLDGFTRVGKIAPFTQQGGDIASREGWRIAVSMLYDTTGREKEKTTRIVKELGLCGDQELRAQFLLLDRHLNCVTSTSAGRLFDAVSALLGVRRASTFEGEASTALMYCAEEAKEKHLFPEHELREKEGGLVLPTDDLFRDLLKGKQQGEKDSELAFAFHAALADQIAAACGKMRESTGLQKICLSGGVFQNRLLLALCEDKLKRMGFAVYRHSLVPPNDGGIGLGQALYAMHWLLKKGD